MIGRACERQVMTTTVFEVFHKLKGKGYSRADRNEPISGHIQLGIDTGAQTRGDSCEQWNAWIQNPECQNKIFEKLSIMLFPSSPPDLSVGKRSKRGS